MDKIRLVYEQTGRARWISHLDALRTMQRVLNRAQVPIRYSEGFNPHALISILMPLSVGTESLCQIADIRVREDLELSSLPQRLSAVMPEGLRVVDAYENGAKPAELKWLRAVGQWEYDDRDGEEMAARCGELFKGEVQVLRRTKRGEGLFSINGHIRELSFSGQDNLIIPALVFSSLLFGIFLVGFKTVFPSSEVREEDSSADLEDGHLSSLMERIDREMVVGELFRKKGLKISDLAEAVGSNRSYVSAAVNKFAGISFSDYVNRYRIRYAQELIRSDRTVQMTEVSDRSGFVDRVSFYRSFKRATGKSPSEWMADFYDLQH